MRPRTSFQVPRLLALGPLLLSSALAVAAGASDPGSAWTRFRGDERLSGRAASDLADDLVPLWTYRDEDGFEATAAIAHKSVYLGSMAGRFVALDLESGNLQWTFEAAAEIKSSALVSDATVFFGDESGLVYALDTTDGSERWRFETEGAVTSSPNLAASCLLFGSYDNYLYCLDPQSGAERWKVETEGYVNASPAVWNDQTASAGCDGLLRLVRLENGEQTAAVEMGGYVGASAAILDDFAFVGSFENQVLGIDLANARVAWIYDPVDKDLPFYSSAAVSPEVVVVGGRDKLLHALDPKTGIARWTLNTSDRIDASPVLAGDRVIIATQGGRVLSVNLTTGKPVWEFETGEPMTASPAIAAGRLIVGTLDGTLFAFGRRQETLSP